MYNPALKTIFIPVLAVYRNKYKMGYPATKL